MVLVHTQTRILACTTCQNGIDFDFYDYVNNYSYDKSSPNLISFDPYYEFFSSNLTNNWNNVVTHENNSINYNKFTPYGPQITSGLQGGNFKAGTLNRVRKHLLFVKALTVLVQGQTRSTLTTITQLLLSI